jgi:hypothetical protein
VVRPKNQNRENVKKATVVRMDRIQVKNATKETEGGVYLL